MRTWPDPSASLPPLAERKKAQIISPLLWAAAAADAARLKAMQRAQPGVAGAAMRKRD